MAQLISLRAYARHRAELGLVGSSLAAVQKAIASSRITPINGKIDPEVADIQWAQKTDADQQARGASGGHPPRSPEKSGAESPAPQGGKAPATGDDRDGYFASKSRRELAEAQLAEIELRTKTGELVKAEDVSRATFSLHRMLRDRLLGVPDRVASIIAAESDTAKVHSILTGELRAALTEVAAALAV